MGTRWRWILLVVVLVLGACTARYVSIGSGGTHEFDLGSEVRDLPLLTPTLLGWVMPIGDPVPIQGVQFSPDNRWLYLWALRGPADQVASVTINRPHDGVWRLDLRLISYPTAGSTAIGIPFATRVYLDPPLWQGYPPITMDVSTGRAVVVSSYRP